MPHFGAFIAGMFGATAPAIASSAFNAYMAGAAFSGWATSSVAGRLLLSVSVSALQMALAPRPDTSIPGIQTQVTSAGGTNPLSFILGKYATGGYMVCPAMSHGANNNYLTYVVELGDIPGQTLETVIVDGQRCTFDTENVHADYGFPLLELRKYVTRTEAVSYNEDGHPRYAEVTYEYDKGWIKYYDGSQTVADPMLLDKYSDYPERPWSADMVGTGLCYAILTFRYDRDVFNNLPKVRFEMGGIPLYDPRLDSTVGGSGTHRWSDKATWAPSTNIGVQIYNIMRGIELPDGSVWGGQMPAEDLPLDVFFAAMNECDVAANLLGGGTEPQYRAGFEVSVDEEPAKVIQELLKGCSGQMAEVGGVWSIRIGAASLPVYFFTDEQLIVSQPQDLKPWPGLSQTYNGISASFPDPESDWETSDAPARYSEELEAEDQGKRLMADLTLPAVPYADQVQRIMLAYLQDQRRFRRHGLTLPPPAALLEPLDVVSWTSSKNGYDEKLFDITEQFNNIKTCLQKASLREVDPADYDWDASLTLPRTPFPTCWVPPEVQPVTDFGAVGTSIPDDQGNLRRPGILIHWDKELGFGSALAGLRWEIRLAANSEVVLLGTVQDISIGSHVISEGVLPATNYQVRAQLLQNTGEGWTNWVPLTTPDTRIKSTDLEDTVQEQLDTADEVRADHDALVAGFTGTLPDLEVDFQAAQQAALDSEAARVAAELAEENASNFASAAETSATSSVAAEASAALSALAAASVGSGNLAVGGDMASHELWTSHYGDAEASNSKVAPSEMWVADVDGNGVPGFEKNIPGHCWNYIATPILIAPNRIFRLSVDLYRSGEIIGSNSFVWQRDNGSYGYNGILEVMPENEWVTVSVDASSQSLSGRSVSAFSKPGISLDHTTSDSAGVIKAKNFRVVDVTDMLAAEASANAAASSETAAAASETAAGSFASAAETSKVAAETAETNAGNSASAAASSASAASASETAAGQSASAADTAKTGAETARAGAETAETNAATSETNASGSASSAASSASAAATSESNAGDSASAAATSASEAETSATDAGQSASAADSSKIAAETAKTGAQHIAEGMYVSDFRDNAAHWVNGYGHSRNAVATHQSVAETSGVSLVSLVGVGNVLQVDGVYRVMSSRAIMPFVEGQKIRVTVRCRLTQDPVAGSGDHQNWLWLAGLNGDDFSGYRVVNGVYRHMGLTAADGWVDQVYEFRPWNVRSVSGATGFGLSTEWRLMVGLNGYDSDIGGAILQVASVTAEDVTQSDAASASAAAAATSASNAAASETDAGVSASAAQADRVAAEAARDDAEGSASAAASSASAASSSATDAGQSASAAQTAKTEAETAQAGAETAETNAAVSETNASTSASAAASSASNAATSENNAGDSATAAASSASLASSSADDAATSASTATVAKNAAETSQAAAETAEANAATSETNAAGSASAAASSASNAAISENNAGDSASAAASSASSASTSATDAATSASAANSSKLDAESASAAASISETNAANSETNAAGSAATAVSAKDTAVQVFSQGAGVLQGRALFENDWSVWAGTHTYIANPVYPAGRAIKFDVDAVTDAGVGIFSTSSYWVGAKDAEVFRVEVEFELISGSSDGAGLLLGWQGDTDYYAQLDLDEGVAGDITVGKRHLATFVVERPAGYTGPFVRNKLYIQANSGSFSPRAAKEIHFYRVQVYPATITDVGVSEHATAIADLEGNAEASYVMRAKAGGAEGAVEIVALADAEGGTASKVTMTGDEIEFDGLSVFDGNLQSADFTAGAAGWKIDETGAAEFNDLVVRSWVQVGAVSDGVTYVNSTETGVDNGETVTQQSLGAFELGQFWQIACSFKYRARQKKVTTTTTKGGTTTETDYLLTWPKLEWRTKEGGVWSSWEELHDFGASARDTDWQDAEVVLSKMGAYEDVEVRISVSTYWSYTARSNGTVYDNFDDINLVARALVR